MQDFSKRIGLVALLHEVAGYSSGVNGKNQAKKKKSLRFAAVNKLFVVVKRLFASTKRLFASTKRLFASVKSLPRQRLLLVATKRRLDEKPVSGWAWRCYYSP